MSKRAGGAVLLVAAVVLGLFAYGGFKRQQQQVAAFAESGASHDVSPATAAGVDIARDVPISSVPTAQTPVLHPPEDQRTATGSADRLVVRQPAPAAASATPQSIQSVREATPEERRLAQAYQREQEAIAAPTAARDSFGPVGTVDRATTVTPPVVGNDAYDGIASLARSLAGGRGATGARQRSGESGPSDSQNSQDAHEAFLAKARSRARDNYLKSTRTPPLSQFEIKAGWEIPAVLEQALNSELPGELKALVTSNVYDTATGQFLLIPQGSRLVGVYDSRIGYGQEGAQVIWDRVIFPDASSLDLSGMIGQDAHGFSGFREKVDRHYRRLIGFAVLTSLFSASAEIAQSRNRTLLTYPSPGEVAASAAGQEVSEVGAQITRRNLNVQPTVKIPIGYRFNVRVNRDVLFDQPYEPLSPGAR